MLISELCSHLVPVVFSGAVQATGGEGGVEGLSLSRRAKIEALGKCAKRHCGKYQLHGIV